MSSIMLINCAKKRQNNFVLEKPVPPMAQALFYEIFIYLHYYFFLHHCL